MKSVIFFKKSKTYSIHNLFPNLKLKSNFKINNIKSLAKSKAGLAALKGKKKALKKKAAGKEEVDLGDQKKGKGGKLLGKRTLNLKNWTKYEKYT